MGTELGSMDWENARLRRTIPAMIRHVNEGMVDVGAFFSDLCYYKSVSICYE